MAQGKERVISEAEVQLNMEALRNNPYPGRGIVMGFNDTGELGIQVYWVMGRSENSRNRMLVRDGETVRTTPFDESKVKDPSLIIYNAMRVAKGLHIVSNGDQTDTIVQAIEEGEGNGWKLHTRKYEPDSPNYTPRISGILCPNPEGSSVLIFSKISKESVDSERAVHTWYSASSNALRGRGKCIHTYEGDGNPLPSFKGEPYEVSLKGTIDDIAKTYWELLNEENKVSLVVKSVNLSTGAVDFRIANKLSKDSI